MTDSHRFDADKIAAKRAAVMKTKPRGRRARSMAAAAGLLLIAAGAGLYALLREPAPQVSPARQSPAAGAEGEISYPVSMFDDGRARFFEYPHGPLTIRYFILKSSDGVLRAAFDACDVCWPAGKGYAQEGDHMVCRNCGLRFASVRVNEVQGGCNPAPLERRVEEGRLVIRAADITAGRGYFDFTRAPRG